MKSECSGALKLDSLGLSYKANRCSDAETRDLGVLTTHIVSPLVMPAQVHVISIMLFRSPMHFHQKWFGGELDAERLQKKSKSLSPKRVHTLLAAG